MKRLARKPIAQSSSLHRGTLWFVALLITAVPALVAYPQETAPSAASPGWVVIPVDEYRTLRARAYPAERPPEPPPVDETLTRVDYDLRVNTAGDLATGRASLTVDVIKDGWVRVGIPAGLLVREARLDSKLVSLVPGKSNQLSAMFSHPGRAVLQLEIALPVNASAGDESISLPSSPSGITRAQVQLPRQGVEVHLTGGLLAEKNESGPESRWLAYGRGNEPLTFSWRRKMDDHRLTQALRMRGSLTELVGLGEDATSVYAEVNLEITQGAAKEARVQLPDKVTINQVTGAMVADWEHKAGVLRVIFLEPQEQSARFVITGETHGPREGNIAVPLLRLLDAERETGGVAVEVLGAGEVRNQKAQGLETADPSELGEAVASRQSPLLVAYKFRTGDSSSARALNVNVARYTQQAVLMANVEEARYQVLMTAEGKTLVQARYAIRNNQRNFLKLVLPQGSAVWSVVLDGKPIKPGESPDHDLLLPLEKSKAGEEAPAFLVEVLYLSRQPAWLEKGAIKLPLPVLDLPISRTGISFYHSPLFHVTTETAAFRVQPYEEPFSPAFKEQFVEEYWSRRDQPVAPKSGPEKDKSDAMQTLLDDFRAKNSGGTTARILPAAVAFPVFGESIFLVAELTAENKLPIVELNYQRDKKKDGGK